MKNIIIIIPNMRSSHCQSRVKNALSEIEGVQIQNLEPGKLIVSVASDNIKNEVEKAIEKRVIMFRHRKTAAYQLSQLNLRHLKSFIN